MALAMQAGEPELGDDETREGAFHEVAKRAAAPAEARRLGLEVPPEEVQAAPDWLPLGTPAEAGGHKP